LPELRGALPREEWCSCGIGRLLLRMSLRGFFPVFNQGILGSSSAMVASHPVVSFDYELVA
jgi:hypothetical protein